MIEINLEQGSDDWKNYRLDKIAASEVPIILGISKWCSPLELFKRKMGFVDDQPDNFAMKRGRDLEPILRTKINKQMNRNFIPKVFVSEEFPWAMASLDGIDGIDILEIKSMGKDAYKAFLKGDIGDVYYAQVQWQMFVTGLKNVIVSAFPASEKISKITEVYFLAETLNIKRDDKFLERIMPKCKAFYESLTSQTPPKSVQKDKQFIAHEDFTVWAENYIVAQHKIEALKKSIKLLEENASQYKEKIIDYTDGKDCIGGGLTITHVKPKGSFDYKAYCEEMQKIFPGMKTFKNKDTFTKNISSYVKITINK